MGTQVSCSKQGSNVTLDNTMIGQKDIPGSVNTFHTFPSEAQSVLWPVLSRYFLISARCSAKAERCLVDRYIKGAWSLLIEDIHDAGCRSKLVTEKQFPILKR